MHMQCSYDFKTRCLNVWLLSPQPSQIRALLCSLRWSGTLCWTTLALNSHQFTLSTSLMLGWKAWAIKPDLNFFLYTKIFHFKRGTMLMWQHHLCKRCCSLHFSTLYFKLVHILKSCHCYNYYTKVWMYNSLYKMQEKISHKFSRFHNWASWLIKCSCIMFYISNFPH